MKPFRLNGVVAALLIVWVVIGFFVILTAERPKRGHRAEALEKIIQQVKAAAQHRVSGKTSSERDSAELLKVLSELKQVIAANLDIREDADKAANWAVWTLRLIGAISIIVLGASLAGGYTLITSSKEQAAILRDCQKLSDESRNIVNELNEDARKVKALRDEFEKKSATSIRNFEETCAGFDFSRLDTVIEALFIKERKLLPAEERARLEDHDVQIQIGEMFGATIDPRVYVSLGRFYRYIGDYGRAVVRFERALERDPAIFEAWIAKALCLAMIARSDPSPARKKDLLQSAFDDSLEKARRLVRDNTEEFQLAFMEGWLLDEVGEFTEAIEAYERAKTFVTDPRVDYNIACSLAKSGRFEEAIQTLSIVQDRQVLREAADDPDFDPLKRDPIFGPRLTALISREEP